MSLVVCLDSEHIAPPIVEAALAAATDPTAAILGLGHCPACPDTPLVSARRGGVEVCPCCWSAWWTENGVVACTPGAVVVDEPAVAARSLPASSAA